MKRPLDILAFSPHPDDVEIGCGGGLILAADKGLLTGVADLSEGECATRGTSEQRRREKARAVELLGLHERYSLGLPDTHIGSEPSHREPVIELIRTVRPRIVLAPYWLDRHPDHEAGGRLVREACFYAGVASVGAQKAFRPERVYYYMIHSPFIPSFVVDISAVWDRKKAVLQAYKSQFWNDEPGTMEKTALSQPQFLRFNEARAIYFGAMVGTSYGEPYLSIPPVPANAIPGIDGFDPPHDGLPAYSPI